MARKPLNFNSAALENFVAPNVVVVRAFTREYAQAGNPGRERAPAIYVPRCTPVRRSNFHSSRFSSLNTLNVVPFTRRDERTSFANFPFRAALTILRNSLGPAVRVLIKSFKVLT